MGLKMVANLVLKFVLYFASFSHMTKCVAQPFLNGPASSFVSNYPKSESSLSVIGWSWDSLG